MMDLLRFFSIQRRLGLIFLAFLCLLVISVLLTFDGLDAQKQDARMINLAGRQRMLLQQMTHLTLSVEYGENGSVTELHNAANTFEQTLAALRKGGVIIDYTGERLELLPPSEPGLKTELDALQRDWDDYHLNIDQLAQSTNPETIRSTANKIKEHSPALVDQSERVVLAFEAISNGRVARLHNYQMAFLVTGLVLLTASWWFTSLSLVEPLDKLERSAHGIGEGDLSSPVTVKGPLEVQMLGETMETMRAQILASRQDLQQWAETLENRVQQRTRELDALASVSREINSHLSINEVLTSVTDKARALLGAEVASLCLLDADGKMLNLHAAAAPEAAIQNNQSPVDNPQVDEILCQHCAHPCGLGSTHGFCQIITPEYRISHLAAPLYSKGQVIGALCVGSATPNAFRPEMAAILTQLSDAAAVAMDNSRLYQQAENFAALEERQRIASEMHDGLLQTLSFLRLMVNLIDEQLAQGEAEKALATLRQIERAEAQAEGEIRQAIESMQDDYPLNDTLQERLAVFAKELSLVGPPVSFESQMIRPLVLSRQESEQVLRVAREAILNAQRHSRSVKVAVYLSKCGSEALLSVQDQGVGFTPGTNPEDGRMHFGLKIMQARAARLGGKLSVRSDPGTGTLVELRWSPGGPSGNGKSGEHPAG